MKTLVHGLASVAAGAAAALVLAGPALAGGPAPVVQVPNPGAVTLISTTIVVGVLAARWLRRK